MRKHDEPAILILVFAVAFLSCTTALAASNICFNSDTNVRRSPDVNGEWMGSVNAGSTLPFGGDTAVDSRGVTWYSVIFITGLVFRWKRGISIQGVY